METKDLIAQLDRIATDCTETHPSVAIVLFTLLGALHSDGDRLLAMLCKGFATQQQSVMNRDN